MASNTLRNMILKNALDTKKEQFKTQQRAIEKQRDYQMKIRFEQEKAKIKNQYNMGKTSSEFGQYDNQFEQPEGYQKESYTIKTPSGVARYKRLITPEEKQAKIDEKRYALQYASDIKMQEKRSEELGKLEQAMYNIKQLKDTAEKLPAGYGGIFSVGREILSRGQTDTDTRIYLKNMPSQAVKLYRDMTGDTRLSDDDAKKRALPLLWHPSEHGNVRTKQFTYLEKMLQAKKLIIENSGFKQNPLDSKEMIIPWEDITATADSLSKSPIPKSDTIPAGYKKVYEVDKTTGKRTGRTKLVPINQ